MDLRKIKKLIDLLEESNLNEIEIKEGEESVRLSRNGGTVAMPTPTYVAAPAPAAAAPAPEEKPAAPAAAGRPAIKLSRPVIKISATSKAEPPPEEKPVPGKIKITLKK